MVLIDSFFFYTASRGSNGEILNFNITKVKMNIRIKSHCDIECFRFDYQYILYNMYEKGLEVDQENIQRSKKTL